MSYEKHLFRRMVEEIDRMAEDEVKLDHEDIAMAINAIGHMAVTNGKFDLLSISALSVAACEFDMYSYNQELPDEKARLLELLMDEQGFTFVGNELYDVWIRRND